MFKKLAVAAALAAALGSASAATTITNVDGTYSFGGFDWSSTASVWIKGYDIVSGGAGRTGQTDVFTMHYQAYAVNMQDANGQNFLPPSMKTTDVAGGYEYTINATLTESVTCMNSDCSAVLINIVSGVWDVYYDTTGDAVLGATGISGVLDGTNILSGNFTSGQPTFGPQGPTNPGNVVLAGVFAGTVTYTDPAYFNNPLLGTLAVSTLQFGNRTTSWNRPSQFDGLGPTGPNTNTDWVGQADANQSFVPEPTTLALAGLALLSVGALRRRKG